MEQLESSIPISPAIANDQTCRAFYIKVRECYKIGGGKNALLCHCQEWRKHVEGGGGRGKEGEKGWRGRRGSMGRRWERGGGGGRGRGGDCVDEGGELCWIQPLQVSWHRLSVSFFWWEGGATLPYQRPLTVLLLQTFSRASFSFRASPHNIRGERRAGKIQISNKQ